MKKLLYFLTLLLFITAGCKKAMDINENPNDATDVSISPDLILPRVLHKTAERMAIEYGFAARWMGYWSRSGSYGPNPDEESYRIGSDFQQTQWSGTGSTGTARMGWYDILFDNDQMEKKAKASGQTFYEGIAKVMKSVGFMYLVDMYNNVPYTEAFDPQKSLQPKYDKGADIYKDLLKQLEEGIALIKDAELSANIKLAESDIMFAGDATKWIKFANTQRLKLLIRQSQVTGVNHATELAKTTAEGFLLSGETASVNPGYSPLEYKQNPFWNVYEKTYVGAIANNFDRANNYVLNLYRDYNDIRYQYFFDTATSPASASAKYVGFNFGEVLSNAPTAAASSNVAGPGLSKNASQDQWLFTSVESLFLQAEAIQRGWLTGDAKAAYEAAVKESFNWLGVTKADSTANAYLIQNNAIVSWDNAATAADKIKLIATQKYLALTGINNFEAWAEYRRLGVPAVPKSKFTTAASNIPLRLRYPQREYNLNAQNVEAEGNPEPLTSPVFWDK